VILETVPSPTLLTYMRKGKRASVAGLEVAAPKNVRHHTFIFIARHEGVPVLLTTRLADVTPL